MLGDTLKHQFSISESTTQWGKGSGHCKASTKAFFWNFREIRERNRQVYFGRSLPTGDQSWYEVYQVYLKQPVKLEYNQNLSTKIYQQRCILFDFWKNQPKIYQRSYMDRCSLRFYQSMDPIMMTMSSHRQVTRCRTWLNVWVFFFPEKKNTGCFGAWAKCKQLRFTGWYLPILAS